MQFLEFDCNLISRIDNPDPELGESDQPAARYGLTHDFLVSPIRDWGNAKQNETLAGRASSQLTQLADQWKITRDRRFLPSLWDFAKFSLFADSTVKGQYNDFWGQSKKHSTVKGVGLLGLIGLICMLGFWGLGAGRAKLESDFNELLVCIPSEFGDKLESITPSLGELKGELLEATSHENPGTRFRANCARLILDQDDEEAFEAIIDDLSQVSSNECATLVGTSKRCGAELTSKWKSNVDQFLARAIELDSTQGNTEEELERIRSDLTACSRLAIHLAYLGDLSSLKKVMSASDNPLPRSIAILALPQWNMGLDELLDRLDTQSSDKGACDLISGICSGVGLGNVVELSPEERAGQVETLRQIFETHFHGGVHYAAWFALKKHKAELPDVTGHTDPNFRWKHISVSLPGGTKMELPMVWIEPGQYPAGAGCNVQRGDAPRSDFGFVDEYPKPGEQVRVEKGFWISTTGISTEDSMKLLEPKRGIHDFVQTNLESIARVEKRLGKSWDPKKVNRDVSLNSSMLLANEVSRLLNRRIFYEDFDSIATIKRNKGNGFRLPTESELEYAWRSSSVTRFYSGNDETIAKKLIGEQTEGALLMPLTAFPPNANGLFGCGIQAERVDTIVMRNQNGKRFPNTIVKGANTGPAPSAKILVFPEFFTYGLCRLVLDKDQAQKPNENP